MPKYEPEASNPSTDASWAHAYGRLLVEVGTLRSDAEAQAARLRRFPLCTMIQEEYEGMVQTVRRASTADMYNPSLYYGDALKANVHTMLVHQACEVEFVMRSENPGYRPKELPMKVC